MPTVPPVIYPKIVAPVNTVIHRIMHRGEDPVRDKWGDRLVEWKKALSGGSDPVFDRELKAYCDVCAGKPSDYGLCQTPQ